MRRPHDAIFFQPVSVAEGVARLTTRYVGARRPPDAANDPDERRSGSATYPGLLTARTASGTCHLAPGYHGEATVLPDGALAAADGVVVEEAGTRYENLRLDDLRRQPQYGTLLNANLDGGRAPVFAVDIPPEGGRKGYEAGVDAVTELVAVTATLAALGVVGVAVGAAVAALLWLPLAMTVCLHVMPPSAMRRPDGIGAFLRGAIARGQLLNAYSLAAARSAAVAETLDTHLLPYLRRELGRRPELVVDYGFAHLDVHTYLRHPRLRRAVLRWYRWHNVSGRDWNYLDTALAFEFDGVTGSNAVETSDGIRHKRVLLRFEPPPGSDPEGAAE